MAINLWRSNYTYSLGVTILISLVCGFEPKNIITWTAISNVTFLDGALRRACAKVHNGACTYSIYYYPATSFDIKEVNTIYRYQQGNITNR